MTNNPYTPPENTCVERRELNPRVLRASMAMTYALLQYGIASYLFFDKRPGDDWFPVQIAGILLTLPFTVPVMFLNFFGCPNNIGSLMSVLANFIAAHSILVLLKRQRQGTRRQQHSK
jgi:hypothetical protein